MRLIRRRFSAPHLHNSPVCLTFASQSNVRSIITRMIQLKDIPKDYLYCFATAEACPRCATCLHALAARLLTESGETQPTVIQSVNPNHAQHPPKDCKHYRDSTPVRFARGMSRLFDDVPMRQGKPLRRKVMACFSCERYFYYSRGGDRLITPKEQEGIARVFRETGISEAPKFDNYEDGILW